MKIKSLVITAILLTSTIWSQAQQINPVPDYVFRNQMSVGRNAVTDTAAYFSIGPRYGATKGFMPPIVGDTATFSSGKRNGLLIFSVQKNKFLYWDSVRVQWSDMAGSSGAYIVAGDTASMLAPYLRKADTTSMLTAYLRKGDTASMLSPYYRSATASAALALKLNISDTASMLGNYIRHAGYGLTKSGQSFLVDTLNIATRAWRQKGIDSVVSIIPAAGVGGSGTTNRIAKFTASGTLGNGSIADSASTVAMTILGTNNVGIGTVTPQYRLHTFGTTGIRAETSSGNISTGIDFASAFVGGRVGGYYSYPGGGAIGNNVFGESANGAIQNIVFSESVFPLKLGTIGAGITQLYTNSLPRLTVTSGGDVGIGTTSPSTALHINRSTGNARITSTATQLSSRADLSFTSRDASNNAVTYYSGSYGDAPLGEVGMSTNHALALVTNNTERLRIFANGRVFIGASPTDAGYQLDINGTLRSVNGANFATTSGNVGIGTTTAGGKLTINSAQGDHIQIQRSGLTDRAIVISASDQLVFGTWAVPTQMALTNAGELLINTTTDAGDYKLQVSGNIYNTGSAVLAATSGNVGIGTASPTGFSDKIVNIYGSTSAELHFTTAGTGTANSDGFVFSIRDSDGLAQIMHRESASLLFGTGDTEAGRINSAREWLLSSGGTDAGDYKLQVEGNARIGTGKLDIASNTTFGLGVARSGTSEVAGQIYNSNGILYLGAESSAGGQIFSGSSAYAAVIGSGANYPLQFATNNATRATITSSGKFIVGATSEYFFSSKMEVNGGMAIRNTPTDGTLLLDSTALNLYGITNRVGFNMNNGKLTGSNASPAFTIFDWTWNTTANVNLVDISLVNTASGASSNYFRISDGTNEFRVTKAAEVVTAAPTGGSVRKWKLGEAATVSPTSPNRTIRIEIDGTVYYLHAKTTND